MRSRPATAAAGAAGQHLPDRGQAAADTAAAIVGLTGCAGDAAITCRIAARRLHGTAAAMMGPPGWNARWLQWFVKRGCGSPPRCACPFQGPAQAEVAISDSVLVYGTLALYRCVTLTYAPDAAPAGTSANGTCKTPRIAK